MVCEGAEPITSLMIGEMGIKTVAVGGDTLYSRPGSFIYLELNTKETDNG